MEAREAREVGLEREERREGRLGEEGGAGVVGAEGGAGGGGVRGVPLRTARGATVEARERGLRRWRAEGLVDTVEGQEEAEATGRGRKRVEAAIVRGVDGGGREGLVGM